MIIENPEALKSWLVAALASLCGEDQDHVESIAEIVLAQAKKKKTKYDLDKAMWKKLFADYLGEKTREFIDKFFVTLETKSYLQSNPGPSTPKINSTTASELELGHFTDFDEKIRKTDMPERMQLRNIPITSVGSDELDLEADWIYKFAFSKASISNQDGTADGRENRIKGPRTVIKIRKALEFIRNQHYEVPFIALYRKESVLPELSVNDLWRVYKFDEKWTQLQTRKNNMMRLFKEMQKYQSEKLTQNLTESIPENVRVLKDEDIDRLRRVQSIEELSDVYNHFTLYYGNDVPAMLEEYRRNSAARQRLNEDGELKDAEDLREDLHDPDEDFYARAGLDGNVVLEYVSPKFSTATEVKAANYMLAEQIAKEPSVRKFVRESFFENARFDVIPTKEGFKLINEMHDLYPMKFLKDKPVRDLVDDQFLRLWVAEQDKLKLLTIVFQTKIEGAITASYLDDIKALFTQDRVHKYVEEWNVLHNEIIDLAISTFVLPTLVKELKEKLLNEARDFVKRACCQQLYNWLKVAPYKVIFDAKEDWDTENGITVLGLSYGADQTVYGCLINGDGEFSNQIRLQHILKGTNAEKEKDLKTIKNFISSEKPHVIAVSAESKKAIMLVEDLEAIISELVKDKKWPTINVELVDNSLAKVFAKSTRAKTEFPQHSLFCEAIIIARVLQDALIAYSQLCNADEDILRLKYHPSQDQLSKEELLEGLYLEFVNRTNEVGVDINRAIKHPHTANVVQFVCGLGPRKAEALIQTLKQNNQRLENRSQLETACHMGPKVFTNCAGFIKIDTHSLGDGAESQVEVLDGSRVHPESYHLARQLAVAALEYHGEKDVDPGGAVRKILEAPERLKGFNLDESVVDNERLGYGNTRFLIDDILSELNHRYKDGRSSYQPPSDEDIFNMVTKETSQTFFKGKMVLATVTGFQRRKPKREELDTANPSRNETTGLWQCPFCLQNDFTDAFKVWNHLYVGSCSGQAIGVSICLENGLSGFIPMKCLSDSEVSNPEEHDRPGQTINCRITKIDVERFSVDLTSKPSDLMDINGAWRPPKDSYYDQPAEDAMLKAEEDSKKHRQNNTERVIAHPASNPVTTVSVQPPPILVVSAPSIDPRANTTSNTTERRSRSPTSRSRSRSPPNRDRDRTAHHSKSRDRSIPNQQPGCSSRDDRRQGGGSPGSSKSYRTSSSPLPPQRSSRSTRSPIPQAPVVAAKDYILVAPSLRSMPIGATPTNQASKGVTKGKSIVIPTVATISVQPLPSLVVSAPSIDPRANTQSDTTERRSRSPTSRSRSRSPNRDRDRTARRYRDHATIGSSNRRNDRSRSPSSRPSPPLPPVVAPAPANFFPLIPLEVFQCAYSRRECPRGDLCPYDHGEPPDLVLLKLLSYISG